MVYEVLVLIQ